MATILENLRAWVRKYLFKSNPIDPPTDYNLARFAIDQHNLKENANLEFVKVVDKKQYLGRGIFYYVTLEAKDGDKVNVYKAQIWERPWLDLQQLATFNLVDDDDTTKTGKVRLISHNQLVD